MGHVAALQIAYNSSTITLSRPIRWRTSGDAHMDQAGYGFGPFVLDLDRLALRIGSEDLGLRPKAFEVLRALIEQQGRVVSKDELVAAVWPDVTVNDDALAQCIRDVRKALGDEDQRYIKTVPRRGYVFVADVLNAEQAVDRGPSTTLPSPDTVRPAPPSQSPLAVAAAPLELPDKPSIVVLPFVNLSDDPSQDYFADGMVEEITIALGRLPWLFVIGSASAFAYKNRPTDIRQVGSELGVRYVLTGSVRREGDSVRITGELSDAAHGMHLWADRFEGRLGSIFEMQDRVAVHVSTMIAPAIQDIEIERARRTPPESQTAYDLYLRALPGHADSPEGNLASLDLLRQAINLDPDYSAAYGLAAWCYFWQKVVGWTLPTDPRLEEGIRMARTTAAKTANDSEALWMAGHALTLLAGEYDTALPLIEKSLSLNPNAPNAWWASGMAHMWSGHTDLSFEHHQRAIRLNPVNPWVYRYAAGIAFGHFFAGQYEKAALVADEPLSQVSSFVPMLRLKAAAYGLLGRIEEGRCYVARLLAANPDATVTTIREYYKAPLRNNPQMMEALLEGLRLSGLAEN